MAQYHAEKVELDAETDYGEGWVEFQWPDSLYGWECLKIDLDRHCSRRMPIRSGDGLPDLVELQRNRIRFRFDPSLARKLELEQDVEITFDISDDEFSDLRRVVDYLFGGEDSRA